MNGAAHSFWTELKNSAPCPAPAASLSRRRTGRNLPRRRERAKWSRRKMSTWASKARNRPPTTVSGCAERPNVDGCPKAVPGTSSRAGHRDDTRPACSSLRTAQGSPHVTRVRRPEDRQHRQRTPRSCACASCAPPGERAGMASGLIDTARQSCRPGPARPERDRSARPPSR